MHDTAALRPLQDDPAFHDARMAASPITVCLWRETGDTAWRAGPTSRTTTSARALGEIRSRHRWRRY
ncbi:hypothetical protein [Streptomyces hokutonensis]|uniref:hypothetical protein n=1 Tax=Streptomyces hokutonensis TaxID=1306990 RepID=UPI0033EB1725